MPTPEPVPPFTLVSSTLQHVENTLYVTTTVSDANGRLFVTNDGVTPVRGLLPGADEPPRAAAQ